MVRWAPLTPRSLKVQIALMARFGSAHSGRKESEGSRAKASLVLKEGASQG